MANPRIVWNGNNLDFPKLLSSIRAPRPADRVMRASHGKVHATSLRHLRDEVTFTLEKFEDADFAASLAAWWSWAARGKQYSFALDPAKNGDTTLTAGRSVGGTSVTVASVAGIAVDDYVWLREAAGAEEEKVKVTSVVSLTVNFTPACKYDYLTGDVLRSEHFYPKVVSLDDELELVQVTVNFDWRHRFVEDAG